tara:strand:- start:612 stop:1559 length:948 start_codon:yes stop_codon:yes gene_type:complete
MINTTKTEHGFQKLDLAVLHAAAQRMKRAVAERRGEKEYTPRDEYQYNDHSHLTARNLEAEGQIDHTAYTLTCKPIPHCGACQGGWVITRPSKASSPISTMCTRCEVPRRWTQRLNKLQLPTDAIGMSLDVYEPDSPRQVELINQTMQYLQRGSDGAPPCTLFYGPPGNGKTSILYALAREACQHHWKVKYTSHTQIMSQIQNSWNDRNRRNPLEGWLDDVQVLLLDEFCGIGGSAHKQGWWVKQTVEIIEQIQRKWRAGELAVVMTTNVYPQQMFKMFESNPAFRSRILGMFEPCEMVGRDRRVDNVDLSKWGM